VDLVGVRVPALKAPVGAATWLLAFATGCQSTTPTRPTPTAASAPQRAPITLGVHPAPRDARDDDVAPTSYDLELTLDPAKDTFSGRVVIGLDVRRAVSEIRLDALDIQIDRASLTHAGREFAPSVDVESAVEQIVLGVPGLQPGTAEVTIDFRARFGREVGAFKPREASTYVFTQFEPVEARRAFPCFDQIRFKVPWTVRLIVPKGMQAFSNAPAEREEILRDGRKIVSFEPTRPLPSYLIAFAVGTFRVTELPRGPVPMRLIERIESRSQASTAQDAPAHLETIAARLGGRIPYPKIDIVTVPGMRYGGMENAGLITAREEWFNPSTIVHELAHHWFGDVVTPAGWAHIWLAEGLTSWVQDGITVDLGSMPDWWALPYWSFARIVREGQPPVLLDAATASDPRSMWDGVANSFRSFEVTSAFHKAPFVLSMLEAWVGRSAIDAGLSSYLSHHADSHATTEDLVWHLAAATRPEVHAVLMSYLTKEGIPEVSARLDCSGPRPWIVVAQRRYEPVGAKTVDRGDPWTIPICVRHELGRDCAILDEPADVIELDAKRCPRWFHANAEGAGFYLQRMPSRDLARLVEVAHRLMEDEAIDVVKTVLAMFESGALEADTSVTYLLRLARNRRETVRRVVFHALETIRSYATHEVSAAVATLATERLGGVEFFSEGAPTGKCEWPKATCASITARHQKRLRSFLRPPRPASRRIPP